uniref:Selenocysteine lyase n=1 Tax=Astyanax mexicanus TaxID=7994 RepID=A0A8B9KEM7_ASTMX
MDYNATTPVDPEVISAVTDALHHAWGNPSSTYLPGAKAKDIITQARGSIATMIGGKAADIIFTSGGTEANNMVFHSALELFWSSRASAEGGREENHQLNGNKVLPHIITSNVEHDSIINAAEHLLKSGKADVTFLPVSKMTGRVEVDDVMAALRPSTCLVSVMLANNETGVIMPIRDICQKVRSAVRPSSSPRVLLHTDAAQAIGKIKVDARELGVDYMTIVGHKFYATRIGALYVNGPGSTTPLYPLLFGGGQERNFRPGYGCTFIPVDTWIYTTSHKFEHTFLFKTPLIMCVLCRPSHILLNCGIAYHVAANALRISVGRATTRKDVDLVVEDLKEAVEKLEQKN